MRVVLICLNGKKKLNKSEDELASLRRVRLAKLNEAQALGIAIGMRDSGRLAPLLVIEKGSPLEDRALENGIPYLLAGPFLRFHLWRWQRKHSRLIIQTIGQPSMRVGQMLFKMRKKDSSILSHAFFIKAPEGKQLKCKAMLKASYVLCGSEHVAQSINDSLGNSAPKTLIDEPGLELENWRPTLPYQAEEDYEGAPHFVFGMAQSLEPMSGALLVIRAMSALWQRADLPPWEVRMFGSGPRFREILNEAESLGVASRLCILDEQPLPLMLQNCHAWLAPGTNPYEFPATTWAGIASSVPVICVHSPLHDERIQTAPDAPAPALRVSSNDPQSLAKAMIGLMRDERLRMRLVHGEEAIRFQIGIEAMSARTRGYFEQWAKELQIKNPEPPASDKQKEEIADKELQDEQVAEDASKLNVADSQDLSKELQAKEAEIKEVQQAEQTDEEVSKLKAADAHD